MIINPTLQYDPRMSGWCVAAKRTLMRWMEMLEDEGVDERERETWTDHDPSWRRTVADAFDKKRFDYGIHRIVFLENDFAIKIDRREGEANLKEWGRWKGLSDQAKQHVFIPYCMTECGTVLIGEKLRVGRNRWDVLQKEQARICEECPEVGRIGDSDFVGNWGLRGDKAVLLDCAGY